MNLAIVLVSSWIRKGICTQNMQVCTTFGFLKQNYCAKGCGPGCAKHLAPGNRLHIDGAQDTLLYINLMVLGVGGGWCTKGWGPVVILGPAPTWPIGAGPETCTIKKR